MSCSTYCIRIMTMHHLTQQHPRFSKHLKRKHSKPGMIPYTKIQALQRWRGSRSSGVALATWVIWGQLESCEPKKNYEKSLYIPLYSKGRSGAQWLVPKHRWILIWHEDTFYRWILIRHEDTFYISFSNKGCYLLFATTLLLMLRNL